MRLSRCRPPLRRQAPFSTEFSAGVGQVGDIGRACAGLRGARRDGRPRGEARGLFLHAQGNLYCSQIEVAVVMKNGVGIASAGGRLRFSFRSGGSAVGISTDETRCARVQRTAPGFRASGCCCPRNAVLSRGTMKSVIYRLARELRREFMEQPCF